MSVPQDPEAEAPSTRDLSRIVGLDVARALALLGMFASHVGDSDDWEWLIAASGRSAALFAVLAGVSMAIMLSRRSVNPSALDLRYTRIRIATRACLLIAFGWFLTALGTPVDVILDNLGLMMLLALPALRWRPAVNAAVGMGVLAVGFWTSGGARLYAPEWLNSIPLLSELWSPHYPVLSWVGYVLVGIAVGQWAPWRDWRQVVQLGLAGLALWVVAVLAAGAAESAFPAANDGVPGREVTTPWTSLLPHSYTIFETFWNVGVALAVVSVCLLIAPHARRLLWPLAATGSMTLTLYSAHIVVIAIVGEEMVWQPSNLALVTLCASAVAFASLWRWRVGQGPLEGWLSRVSRAAAVAGTSELEPEATSP